MRKVKMATSTMAPIATPESSTSNAPVRSRMKTARWVSIASAAILGAIVASHAAPASAADTIAVVLDQAKVLQLPPNTATIIVGNPLIADITMINRNTQLILTGKSFGQTNMIALDRKGNSIGESTVIVRAAKTGLLVQRGLTQETYSCEPRCQPTITLGDDPKFTRGAITAVTARSSAVSTASKN